jgi:hypothetical protein
MHTTPPAGLSDRLTSQYGIMLVSACPTLIYTVYRNTA